MKIKVTQKNIDEGRKDSAHYCPIALAFREKGLICVAVGKESGIIVGDKSYKHSKKSLEFVKRFDNGEKVEPFTFEARRYE